MTSCAVNPRNYGTAVYHNCAGFEYQQYTLVGLQVSFSDIAFRNCSMRYAKPRTPLQDCEKIPSDLAMGNGEFGTILASGSAPFNGNYYLERSWIYIGLI